MVIQSGWRWSSVFRCKVLWEIGANGGDDAIDAKPEPDAAFDTAADPGDVIASVIPCQKAVDATTKPKPQPKGTVTKFTDGYTTVTHLRAQLSPEATQGTISVANIYHIGVQIQEHLWHATQVTNQSRLGKVYPDTLSKVARCSSAVPRATILSERVLQFLIRQLLQILQILRILRILRLTFFSEFFRFVRTS